LQAIARSFLRLSYVYFLVGKMFTNIIQQIAALEPLCDECLQRRSAAQSLVRRAQRRQTGKKHLCPCQQTSGGYFHSLALSTHFETSLSTLGLTDNQFVTKSAAPTVAGECLHQFTVALQLFLFALDTKMYHVVFLDAVRAIPTARQTGAAYGSPANVIAHFDVPSWACTRIVLCHLVSPLFLVLVTDTMDSI